MKDQPETTAPDRRRQKRITTGDAVRAQARAARDRALASEMREAWGDRTGALLVEMEADATEAAAAHALDPLSHVTHPLRPGNGGELVVATKDVLAEKPGIVDTVRKRGDMLAADASMQRLDLAGEAGALVLAVDAAESIQAQNSLERELAHQMAAAHALAMKMIGAAREDLSAYAASGHRYPHRSQEAARMATTAARLMDAYQRGLLTLDRLRTGGKQTVVVQHVTVADGGQAVVAGTVRRGRRGDRPK
ncbi:MAG TPA: hypothetical protein VGN83_20385 [Falsiroseomonas sp.]|jgi:hypothetical protein|nr:hypothetical protein [Falsiroseomonas sp.]